MSRLYEDQHRALQDRFESRPMADRIEQIALKTEIGPDEQAFIESREFFFLTTVDSQSRPTVSYKGGALGFVRVVDPTTIMFPSYDGNGMYLSMGNITANPHVGLVVVAKKDGKEITYSVHGRSPAEWRREGWKPSDFKVGDKVSVIGFPRRDNGLEVAIKTFTRVSDGKNFGAPAVQK